MGRVIVDFVGISLLGAIAFTAVEYFFSINAPNGSVTTVIAGMVAGQLYGGRTGREGSSGFAWKVAGVLTAVSLLLFSMLAAGLYYLRAPMFPAGISVSQLIVALAVAAIVGILIIRFTFRWGVKMGAKNSPKRTDAEIFD